MKKFISIIFVLFIFNMSIFSDDVFIGNFLVNYFENEAIHSEQITIAHKEMIFAFRNIGEEIFDKGIIFQSNELNEVIPYVYITNNVIMDRDGCVIFKGEILTQKFFGWKIDIAEKNNSFSLNFYTNEGKNVTEGPIFIWDTNQNNFKLYEIDRSQW